MQHNSRKSSESLERTDSIKAMNNMLYYRKYIYWRQIERLTGKYMRTTNTDPTIAIHIDFVRNRIIVRLLLYLVTIKRSE